MWKKVLAAILAILILLVLYLAFFRKSETLSPQTVKARYQVPLSHYLDWNGTEIHYTDAGSGMPVLMIHGLGGSAYDFAILDSLMRDSYRVIRVDLPGFGLSGFPAIDKDTADYTGIYSNFFRFFLDTLHLDSMFVIGNSMGGMMAWLLAVNEPAKVKKLVLLSSAGYDIEEVQKRVTRKSNQKWMQFLVRKGIPEYLTRQGLKNVFFDPATLSDEKVKRVNDFWNMEGHMQVIFGIAGTKKFPATSLIRQVKCPTLILWGKQDKLVPEEHAQRFHRDISRSRVIVYDSCGHVPQMERPLDVSRDVRQFFNE